MSAIAASFSATTTMPVATPIRRTRPLTIAGQPLGAVLKTAAPVLANGLGLYIWLVIL